MDTYTRPDCCTAWHSPRHEGPCIAPRQRKQHRKTDGAQACRVRPPQSGSHTWEGAEADVGGGRVNDVLVDLVGEHQQPRVGRHHRRDLLQQRPARQFATALVTSWTGDGPWWTDFGHLQLAGPASASSATSPCSAELRHGIPEAGLPVAALTSFSATSSTQPNHMRYHESISHDCATRRTPRCI